MEQKQSEQNWWEQGVRFECQGSGNCCVSRGEYGFVYVNIEDRRLLAKELKVSTRAFTLKYCEKTDGHYHLKETKEQLECMFLKNNKCSVYAGRPTQCRTWPFWPENMDAKRWKTEVQTFCPGVGKGKVVPVDKIKTQLNQQAKSELLK